MIRPLLFAGARGALPRRESTNHCMRIRLCATGWYSLYNDQGQLIARTLPANNQVNLNAGQLRTGAARMAYAEELAAVCRVADLDYEQSGIVAASTIMAIRQLLSDIGAA